MNVDSIPSRDEIEQVLRRIVDAITPIVRAIAACFEKLKTAMINAGFSQEKLFASDEFKRLMAAIEREQKRERNRKRYYRQYERRRRVNP